jgi:dihydrofolate reductase
MGKNGTIGRGDELPWPREKARSDLRWFRNLTMGHPIVMGRKTLASIGKVLDGRFNLVLSRQLDGIPFECIPDIDGPKNWMACVVNSIPELMERWLDRHPWPPSLSAYHEEIFVIGGEQVYRQFLDRANKMYLKVFDREFEGDVVFPRYNDPGFMGQWELVSMTREAPDGEYERVLAVYERV